MAEVDVSLVMAAYSPRPEWLRGAVSSALAQSGCRVELVLVDDGSPVPVADLLDDVADPRLSVVRVDHGGEGAARNIGIASSSGRYVRFLDADDLYPRDSTARLLKLAASGADIVACGATRWCRANLEPLFDWTVRWHGDPLEALLLMRCTVSASILVSRRLVERVGPWRTDLAIGHDWDFQLRLLEHGRLHATRRVAAWYRQQEGSSRRDQSGGRLPRNRSTRAAGLRDCAMILESYFERHPSQRATKLEQQAYAALTLLAAEFECAPRGPWNDRRFWAVLARDPTSLAFVYERHLRPRFARVKLIAQSRLHRAGAA